MADRDDTEKPSSENPGSENPASEAAAEALPCVEAPSISPAKAEDEPAIASEASVELPLPRSSPGARRWFTPGAIAAAALLGVAIGALATSYLVAPRNDPSTAERQAMQQSIARLSQEVGTLKAGLASASKSAHAQTAQIAKLNETLAEKLARDAAAVTASIAPTQTAPAAAAPAQQMSAPLPPPRPAAHIAARMDSRDARVSGWSVLGARGGFVYVRSGREIFRVAPGARLPGLGLVEEIRRQDGHWIVVTARGLIVAERGRRFYDYDEPY
jgi:hypothetical protein